MEKKHFPRQELQEYFDQNPLVAVRGGSQSRVYRGGGLMVKVFKPFVLERRITEPGATTYGRHVVGKTRLRELAVPFEPCENFRATIKPSMPDAQFESRNFAQVAVQEACEDEQTLAAMLKLACADRDFDKLNHLLQKFIQFRADLLRRGAYLHDSTPDNIVLPNSDMLLRDIGAVTFATREKLLAMSNSLFRRIFARPIAWRSFARCVSDDAQYELGRRGEWLAFRRQFGDFYDPAELEKHLPRRRELRSFANRDVMAENTVPNVRIPKMKPLM